jgi:hypothetical protein
MSRSNAFLLYLYSTRNIVGSLLGLLGLAAFFGGVIHQWWLPICLGLYLAGALLVPSQTLLDVDVYQQYDNQRLVEGVEQLLAQVRKQLPDEALTVLASIPQVLHALLPRLTGMGGSPMLPPDQIQTVIGAITRDLPQTVAGYLRLPSAFANFHTLEGGKTAKDLLTEQLLILKSQLDKIAEAAFRDDAEALLTNGQYLKEKFHAPTYLR